MDLIGKRVDLLDKGWIELQDVMGDDLAVVNAARTSYLGESKGDEQDKKLLFYMMENGHTSPFEQVQFKFRVKCPIFVARQWMRHRTWSFNEQSRRYSDDTPEFYMPDKFRLQDTKDKQNSSGEFDYLMNETFRESLSYVYTYVSRIYMDMISDGVAREQARMILPVSLYTTFVGSIDAHNLMHFLKLRMDAHAQYEIRVYADAIYSEFFRHILPWTAEAFEKYVLKG